MVILGLSNLGTAFAAARLTKDTSVEESSGRMIVQGESSKTIVMQGAGNTLHAHVYASDDNATSTLICVTTRELSAAYQNNCDGITTTLLMQSTDGNRLSVELMEISRSGASQNETHVVLQGQKDNRTLIFDLESDACDFLSQKQSTTGIRRGLESRFESIVEETDVHGVHTSRHLTFQDQSGSVRRAESTWKTDSAGYTAGIIYS